MESSTDDGDPATTSAARYLLVISLTLTTCYQQPQGVVIEAHYQPLTPQEVALSESPPAKKKPAKKKVYLTFDDGPNRGTKNVLDIVKDERVPVSFFLVGEHAFASYSQAQTWDSLQIAKHIALCNHGFTHAHNRYEQFYANPDSVVADFKRAHDSLGLTNNIVRTPGRNIWRIDSLQYTDLNKSKAAANSLQKAGFVVMGWDLEWHYDAKSLSVRTSAEELLRQIDSVFEKGKTKHPDHLVLLAHDQVYHKSADSFQLRQFIQQLKKREDYELVMATEYPGAGKQSMIDTLPN